MTNDDVITAISQFQVEQKALNTGLAELRTEVTQLQTLEVKGDRERRERQRGRTLNVFSLCTFLGHWDVSERLRELYRKRGKETRDTR
jgi:hypothetical protein